MKRREIKSLSKHISPIDTKHRSEYQITSSQGKPIRRLVIHVSIRPQTKLNSNRHFCSDFSNNQERTTQQSFSKFNPYTNSSTYFDHQINKKKNFDLNRKYILEYLNEKKRRRYFPTTRRCLWIILCLCTTLLIRSVLTVVLLAVLIKSNSTTTITTTSISTLSSTSTTITTTTSISTSTSSSTSTTSTTTTSSSSSTTSTISTTVLITGNVTTNFSLSNWYGKYSLYFPCSGVIEDAYIEIDVLITAGLTYGGQFEINGGGVFTRSSITNSTHVVYRWKMNSGQTIVCGNSSIEFDAQFNLNGIAHSTTNDYYLVTTTNNLNITTTINGYF